MEVTAEWTLLADWSKLISKLMEFLHSRMFSPSSGRHFLVAPNFSW